VFLQEQSRSAQQIKELGDTLADAGQALSADDAEQEHGRSPGASAYLRSHKLRWCIHPQAEKKVVAVKANSTAEVDFVADNPGMTLFHCHQQSHMDFGFTMLLRYV
jgi:hypothetical protein